MVHQQVSVMFPLVGFSGLNIGLQNGDAEMSGNSPGRVVI